MLVFVARTPPPSAACARSELKQEYWEMLDMQAEVQDEVGPGHGKGGHLSTPTAGNQRRCGHAGHNGQLAGDRMDGREGVPQELVESPQR